MPTVVVTWTGKCTDWAIQQSLCSKIAELGDLSHSLFRDSFGGNNKPVYYDGQILSEKFLLSKNLFSDQAIPPMLERVSQELYATNQVGLYGIEFTLFDPRKFNSLLTMAHNDTLSIVFLRSGIRDLDGRMVQVHHLRRDIEPALDESYRYLLTVPELDLRYYLERWIGELLGWVKRFYVSNLSYWAWVENPGYAGYEHITAEDNRTRDEIFFYIREAFLEEADDWKSYCLRNQHISSQEFSIADWAQLENEYYHQLAQKEKRNRNRGT